MTPGDPSRRRELGDGSFGALDLGPNDDFTATITRSAPTALRRSARLQDPVRVALENHTVLEAPRLALGAVDDHRRRQDRRDVLGHGSPLRTGGKPAPPRPRSPDASISSIVARLPVAAAASSPPPPPVGRRRRASAPARVEHSRRRVAWRRSTFSSGRPGRRRSSAPGRSPGPARCTEPRRRRRPRPQPATASRPAGRRPS